MFVIIKKNYRIFFLTRNSQLYWIKLLFRVEAQPKLCHGINSCLGRSRQARGRQPTHRHPRTDQPEEKKDQAAPNY